MRSWSIELQQDAIPKPGKILNQNQVDNLGDFIRECNTLKAVQRATEADLDQCEFHPERYWTRTEAVTGMILTALVTGFIVASTKGKL
jgi:hypothetical protein